MPLTSCDWFLLAATFISEVVISLSVIFSFSVYILNGFVFLSFSVIALLTSGVISFFNSSIGAIGCDGLISFNVFSFNAILESELIFESLK